MLKGEINVKRDRQTHDRRIRLAFAHAGHISKEEAKEISGLPDEDFEKVYAKASNFAEKVMKHEGNKMDKFLEHFAREIDEYVAHFGSKFFM